MDLNDKQKEIIEKVGVTYERSGIPPAAARVLGLLYVADNPEVPFDEITKTLQISKSATSNAINFLLTTDQIEYTTYLGDRKRYFRLKLSNWRQTFTKRIEGMTKINETLTEVLEVRTHDTKEFNHNLESFVDFLKFINKELPKLLKKWEDSKK